MIIPEENAKDLKEVPDDILRDLEIIPVAHMDEVLEKALVSPGPEKIFCGREDISPLSNTLLKEQYHTQ